MSNVQPGDVAVYRPVSRHPDAGLIVEVKGPALEWPGVDPEGYRYDPRPSHYIGVLCWLCRSLTPLFDGGHYANFPDSALRRIEPERASDVVETSEEQTA